MPRVGWFCVLIKAIMGRARVRRVRSEGRVNFKMVMRVVWW
jgi:hypothetical protein